LAPHVEGLQEWKACKSARSALVVVQVSDAQRNYVAVTVVSLVTLVTLLSLSDADIKRVGYQ